VRALLLSGHKISPCPGRRFECCVRSSGLCALQTREDAHRSAVQLADAGNEKGSENAAVKVIRKEFVPSSWVRRHGVPLDLTGPISLGCGSIQSGTRQRNLLTFSSSVTVGPVTRNRPFAFSVSSSAQTSGAAPYRMPTRRTNDWSRRGRDFKELSRLLRAWSSRMRPSYSEKTFERREANL
jgi:hypothetical protein